MPINEKVPDIVIPLTGLRLLLPAILPSWRFFDAVSASPRLDYCLLSATGKPSAPWQAFRPRPAILTLSSMMRRLAWNAQWNEDLFLASLSERLMSASSSPETVAHSQRELLLRVARHLDRQGACDREGQLQIRLRMVSRIGSDDQIGSDIVYLSSPYPIAELITP